MLDRLFQFEKPLKHKWSSHYFADYKTNKLYILSYHYHHLISIYCLDTDDFYLTWHEKPADLRGLNAIKAYYKENHEVIQQWKTTNLQALTQHLLQESRD